jgi:outer membrane lipoprotein carrier protein
MSPVCSPRASWLLRMVGLGLTLLLVLPWAARADGLQSLQDFLQHSRSGRAEFVQKVTAPAREGQSPRVKTSRGQLAYQRPDQFRLEYLTPDPQLLVSDGRQFWHQDTDLQQVTVRKWQSVLGSAPAALILTASDLKALQGAFEIRALPDADGLSWAELKPRTSEGTLRLLRVGLQGSGPATRVAVLEFLDGFGQASRLELSGFASTPQPPALFVLTPPAGFQVLRP